MIEVNDAPWIGLCAEDYADKCRMYEEEQDDAYERWKEEQEVNA